MTTRLTDYAAEQLDRMLANAVFLLNILHSPQVSATLAINFVSLAECHQTILDEIHRFMMLLVKSYKWPQTDGLSAPYNTVSGQAVCIFGYSGRSGHFNFFLQELQITGFKIFWAFQLMKYPSGGPYSPLMPLLP